MFAASCIGVALLAILLESLRRIGKEYDALVYRQFNARAKALEVKARNMLPAAGAGNCACAADEAGSLPSLESARVQDTRPVELSGLFTFRASPIQQLIRAFIHALTFAVAYILMREYPDATLAPLSLYRKTDLGPSPAFAVIGMYYNGFMLISIFLGIGIGKFLTDWLVVKVFIDASTSKTESSARGKHSKTSGAESVPDDRNPTVCCG